MKTEKKCCECGGIKPLKEFNRNSRADDGLQSNCRVCQGQMAKARALANKEKWSKIDPYTGEPYEVDGGQ